MKGQSDSRPRRVRSVLKSTVAAVCAVSVGSAPLTPAFAAAEQALRANGPVEVRVANGGDFTRVEFLGPLGQRAQVVSAPGQIIVRLPRGAQPNLARLRVDPPPGVAGVDTRPGANGLEIVISLEKGASAKTGRSDGSVYLNLYPSKPEEAAKSTTADAVPAGGVVKVAATLDGQALTLKFPWKAPLGAAVFRRGEAVWVVFDARAKLDMSSAPKALGGVKRVRWVNGPDFTVVRIDAPEPVSVAASSDGPVWTVTLGGPVGEPQTAVKIDRDDQTGAPALTAALAGATKVVWLVDPAVGDRFAAVTALGSSKAVDRRRAFVDTTLLKTVQGVALEAPATDLKVSIDGDLVRIERPHGLTLSAPGAMAKAAPAADDLPKPAVLPALIDTERWARVGPDGFLGRYRHLQDLAGIETAKGAGAGTGARMALARFLVGSQLQYEAIGVLDMAAKAQPSLMSDPEFRGLRGAARAMVGRYKEAQADFSAPVTANDPASSLWRGYVDCKLGNWAEARKAFTAGSRAIDLFDPTWKSKFAAAHAQAALELKDLPAARSLLAFALAQQTDPSVELDALLIQARVLEADGQSDRALAVYEAIARAPLGAVATPALLRATRIKYDKGMIQAPEAVHTLDSLRFRWRGDATELEVISTLGQIYLSQGRYREALEALRSAGNRMVDLPAAVQLQAELSEAFRKLFLEGQADALEPVQALALFYDFRDLTPVGADGDEMVRRLSRRLVDVDLLTQAAELLKYQVDNRLDGVAKSQVATDLAAVYLMDHKPEQALQAIWGSRTTLLPNALNAQRRVLEARALSDLTRYDNALEVLGKDATPDAQDVRAEVLWRQKDWGAAAAAYEKRLGERWKTPGTALTGEEETRLIRAGVAFSLAADPKGLARLSEHFSPFVDGARAPEALRVALAGMDGTSIGPAEFAKAVSQADTFASWVAAMKQRFRAPAAAKS